MNSSLKSHGFSLVELLIALSLFAMTAIFMTRMSLDQQRNLSYQEKRMVFLSLRFLAGQISRESPTEFCRAIKLKDGETLIPTEAEVTAYAKAMNSPVIPIPSPSPMPLFDTYSSTNIDGGNPLKDLLGGAPSGIIATLKLTYDEFKCAPATSSAPETCKSKIILEGKFANGLSPKADAFDVELAVETKDSKRLLKSCKLRGASVAIPTSTAQFQSCRTVDSGDPVQTAEAFCPIGESRTGGGCEEFGSAYMYLNFPIKGADGREGWRCNSGSTGTLARAYAICCSTVGAPVAPTALVCPASMTKVSGSLGEYCISTQKSETAMLGADALNYCQAKGAQLCSLEEWTNACKTLPDSLGFKSGGVERNTTPGMCRGGDVNRDCTSWNYGSNCNIYSEPERIRCCYR